MKQIPRDKERIHPQLRQTIKACLLGESPWPLLITGSCGCGKTCAALSACDHVSESHYATLSGFYRDLLAAQRGELHTSTGYKRSAGSVWHDIESATLLVVDEIGLRATVSDPMFEAVRDLADMREHRATIYISNVAVEKIGEIFDARVLSRMACGTVVHVEGADRRFEV
jgi:DNA replication protein DnaC